jgi:hypothetical protein
MNARCARSLFFLLTALLTCSGLRASVPDTAIAGAAPAVQLTAETSGQQVKLSWTVADSLGGGHFVVETATDGTSFSPIAYIRTGKAPQARSYTHTQDGLPKGIQYFRVKLVDEDGADVASGTVQVMIGPKRNLMVYPNPSSGQVTVSHPPGGGKEELQVIDMNGQTYKRAVIAMGTIQTPLDLRNLQKGVYQVIWLSGQERVSQRFIIQ